MCVMITVILVVFLMNFICLFLMFGSGWRTEEYFLKDNVYVCR